MTERPFSFSDLPRSAFPVVITAYYEKKQIWRRTIDPYVITEIPGRPEEIPEGSIKDPSQVR